MHRVLPIVLLVALASSADADDDFFDDAFQAALAYGRGMTVSVPPHDFVEACVSLQPGSHRRYTFTTQTPLNFNVHYHDQDKVLYVAAERDVVTDTGLITADQANIYCWMWENREPTAARLTFRIWIAAG